MHRPERRGLSQAETMLSSIFGCDCVAFVRRMFRNQVSGRDEVIDQNERRVAWKTFDCKEAAIGFVLVAR